MPHTRELGGVIVAVVNVGPVGVGVAQSFVPMRMTVAQVGGGVVVPVEMVPVVMAMAVDVLEWRVRMEMEVTDRRAHV